MPLQGDALKVKEEIDQDAKLQPVLLALIESNNLSELYGRFRARALGENLDSRPLDSRRYIYSSVNNLPLYLDRSERNKRPWIAGDPVDCRDNGKYASGKNQINILFYRGPVRYNDGGEFSFLYIVNIWVPLGERTEIGAGFNKDDLALVLRNIKLEDDTIGVLF